MKFTAAEIANMIEGKVDGDDTVEISSLSKIEESTHGSLTFLANPKYTQYIYTKKDHICIRFQEILNYIYRNIGINNHT